MFNRFQYIYHQYSFLKMPTAPQADDYFKPLVEGDVLSASMPQRCIVGSMFVGSPNAALLLNHWTVAFVWLRALWYVIVFKCV